MFLQDSVVTQTVVLGGLITLSTSCKFPMMSMCQKLRKLVESRHSYRNEKMGQFFGLLCTSGSAKDYCGTTYYHIIILVICLKFRKIAITALS